LIVDFGWGSGPGWLNDNPLIISLFPLLTSLEEVAIQGSILYHFSWSSLSSAVQIALHNLLAQPHVVSLFLYKVHDMDISAFSQFHHLKELALRDVHPKVESPSEKGACLLLQPGSQLEHRTKSLRSLTATGSSAFLSEALSVCTEATLSFRNLQQLTLLVPSYDKDLPSTLASLAKACGSSLKTYHASFPIGILSHATVSSALRLRLFPNLTSFSLAATVDNKSFLRMSGRDVIRILASELDLLPGSGIQLGSLNSILLYIETRAIGQRCVTVKKQLLDYCSEAVWSRLDEVLARPGFTFLREVSILFGICMKELCRQDLVEVKELIGARMPNLQEKGIVTVSYREIDHSES
jgi:hypothetical protein